MNTAPIHGTTQHLNARIAAASSPSKPAEITHFGIFTTEVRVDSAVRHLYVSSGCDVLPPVWGEVSSLKDLNIAAMIHTSLDVSHLFTDLTVLLTDPFSIFL
jgi:hypothetical protein